MVYLCNVVRIITRQHVSIYEWHNMIYIMKNRISIFDFSFMPAGFGHYKVTCTSPVTFKKWTCVTPDMMLIDTTKNADSPKVKDLNELKRICKNSLK